MDIEYLKRCSQLCTECCSETCVFNPQGICMAPFLTGKKPGIHDDGCTDYCPKPLDGLELVCSYSEHELRSYEEDVREHISQFTDEELCLLIGELPVGTEHRKNGLRCGLTGDKGVHEH